MATTDQAISSVLTINQFLWIGSLAGLATMLAALAVWIYAVVRIRSATTIIGLVGAILYLAWFPLSRLRSVDTPDLISILLLIVLPTIGALLQTVAVWGLVRAYLSRV